MFLGSPAENCSCKTVICIVQVLYLVVVHQSVMAQNLLVATSDFLIFLLGYPKKVVQTQIAYIFFLYLLINVSHHISQLKNGPKTRLITN